MSDAFSGFKIERWYHALIAMGAAGTVAALAFPFPGVANAHVLLAALGLFFVGIGEWINHPLQTRVGINFTITGYPRRPSSLGTLFDLMGALLLAIGLGKIIAAAG